MFEGARFATYRTAIGLATLAGFRGQRVVPLGLPGPDRPDVVPFASSFPAVPVEGLFDPVGLPASDAARMHRIERSARLLHLVDRIAPSRTPPVPGRHDAFVDTVYTGLLRRCWPTAPEVPPALRPRASDTHDVLAALAVSGPFASYLRAGDEGDDSGVDGAGAGPAYLLDVAWMLGYPVRAGLLAPGGAAVLRVVDGALRTECIRRGDDSVRPRPWRARFLEREALLAGLNEDLTTFRHNVGVHLATLTPFAVATARRLDPSHPVRRLLHHCFHTVLVGNHELARFQLGSAGAFGARIFAHDHTTLARMASDRLAGYDFWDFEPPRQFATRGTTSTPFAYPYRDNMLRLWTATSEYTQRYLRVYLTDGELAADHELSAWLDDLDGLLPNGIRRDGQTIDVDWLARVCATLIHLSTVEHDVLNNVVWNYGTLGWLVPTVVPLNGERMDQRRAFDLIATLIVTWKPYNMLLSSDIPSIAPDARGAAEMRRWLDDLGEIQRSMASGERDPALSYPANLNVSISN